MRRFLPLSILFLICFTCLSAQDDPALFDDDPMQHLPVGMEYSKYVLREPTGLAEVEPRIEPPNWWVDMEDARLEIMIYDRGVAQYDEVRLDNGDIRVEYVKRLENPNYLFVGLVLGGEVEPGSLTLTLASSVRAQNSGTAPPPRSYPYELLAHPREEWTYRQQLSSRDLIYLVMPDRFANGDPTNDKVHTATDTILNRNKLLFRHGGDLQGVIDNLNYLEDLGVTALWLNPVLENDQPYASYHGYAVTDHYRIDPRFGDNAKYRELVEKAHEKGIKVIMDVIFNHVGDQHWQIADLPSKDWIHQWPEYTQTTYRAATLFDPNAAETDRKRMTDGWFDKHMPDLNQDNDHLANYLIQNSLWWTLYSNQDGFRLDTYAYSDAEFMARWNARMLREVPHLGIFGETWVHGPGVQAWFAGGDQLNQRVNSNLPGVTDFQVYYAIHEALNAQPGWTDGVMRLYYVLAQDYLYPDASQNVTFLDNHDLARLFTSLGEDVTKFKSALALLMTTRGIPMLYYGTELGFTGAGGAFGEGGRVDFPGGFAGDERNLFTLFDRNDQENDLFNFVRTLARYRKDSEALTVGKLTQFVPQDGMYVYFRTAGDERIMVVLNANDQARTLDARGVFDEVAGGSTSGKDLTREMAPVDLGRVELQPKETRILLLD